MSKNIFSLAGKVLILSSLLHFPLKLTEDAWPSILMKPRSREQRIRSSWLDLAPVFRIVFLSVRSGSQNSFPTGQIRFLEQFPYRLDPVFRLGFPPVRSGSLNSFPTGGIILECTITIRDDMYSVQIRVRYVLDGRSLVNNKDMEFKFEEKKEKLTDENQTLSNRA